MTPSIRPLLALLLVFLTAAAFAQQATAPLPGQLLLRLAKDADAARIEQQLARALPAGVHLKELSTLGEGSRYRKVVVDDATVSIDLLRERLGAVPGVEATHPNLPVRFRLAPNDPQYSAQWHMQSINVEPVWNVTTGGAMANGMRIAVGINDSGVDAGHPDLLDNVAEAGIAVEAHGTQVAGVVGAVGNNNLGVTGVNWDVDLLSFANTVNLSDAFTQFQQCLNARSQFNQSGGVNGRLVVAITVSWGAAGVDCGFGEPMFDDLGVQGVLVITAGDNQPTDIDVVPDYPATCPHTNNIVVTSLGPLNEIPFAIGDNTVHLLAPGVDIVTTTTGGGFATVDGNSFAIPHVAGAVALLYSNDCEQFAAAALLDPQGTALTVKDAILNSVTPVPGAGALTITGGKLNVSGAFNQLNALCGSFCDSVTVTFTNNEGITDPVWQLVSDQSALQNGGGTSVAACLPDGCYTLGVFDDPFNQQPLTGTYTITGAGGVVLASGSYSGTIPIQAGVLIPGCTDPGFASYDPDANCNDGSCCSNLATLTLNDSGGDGWEGATWTLTNTATNTSITGTLLSGSTADTTFCLPTGCYTLTVSSGADDAEISWSIGGVNVGADNGGADTTITVFAGSPITGCMDPAFCNYNPFATCPGQCLAGSTVGLFVGGGDFPEEIGWTLLDGDGNVLLSGGGEEFFNICLPPGCDYVMQMTDQAGDGWNGNFYFIVDIDGNMLQGTLPDGSSGADTLAINAVSGCTDPLAVNFNALATCDDGTCCFGPGEIALLVDVFAPGEPVLWTLTDGALDTVGTGGAGSGQHVCAAPACDFAFTLVALDPPDWSGAAYTISAADGSWTTSRSIGQDTAMAFPVAVGGTFGCTDALANNFSPDATCDDGTCCYGTQVPMVLYSQPPGADSTWVLVDANDSTLYTSNGYFEQSTCVEPSCSLTLIVEDVAGDGQPSFVDVYEAGGNLYGSAFADEGDSTATPLIFILQQGCTDPAANNFDPAADCDNGTCCYGTTSLVIFSSSAVSANWQLVDSTNAVVATGPGGVNTNVCVQPSCNYTFIVTDSIVDGSPVFVVAHDAASGIETLAAASDGGSTSIPIILGGTYGCTDPAAANFDPGAVCDNGTCCLGSTAQLFIQPDDFFSEGSADVTITQGSTTVFSGQVPIVFDDDFGVSLGEFGFCAADGCLSIDVGEFDVPLFTQSFLVLNNDFDNAIGFNTMLGLQTVIGGSFGTEVCDGSDNDCDGQIDEDFFWYTDADGDGYGDAATGFFNCTPQPGLINVGGDCNDANPAVYPGATEVCDGFDTNCDGTSDLALTGCTDPMACNYDPNAICDDGNCVQGSVVTGNETFATDFTATDVNGNPVNLFALLAQGKTVILDFFTTWCPPSTAMNSSGFLQEWYAHMGPAGLDHIRMVSIEIEDTATVTGSLAPFVADATWPIIATGGTAIMQQYAALGLYNGFVPTLVMICPDRSAQRIFGLPDQLPYTGFFDYDPSAALQLLNDKCGCRSTPCLTNIGCMDSTSCNYDPLATCPGACTPASEWFTDADGDGFGSTSLGTSCTPIPGAAQQGGDCDDTDPLAWIDFSLYVFTDDPNEFGTAHYVITQGTTVIQGDLDLPAVTEGVGILPICLGNGCFTISITQNDVALFPEAFVVYPEDDQNFIPFEIATGFSDALGGISAEVCDGVDNDCDGSVDEGFNITWFTDADGDGYGDPATAVTSCTQPPGTIGTGGDCNDASASVNPDATEVCNGIDDDCDGGLDNTGASWYLDADGDGFGDPATEVLACTQPTGMIATAGDCDDSAPTTNPNATELCDGADNDCDGFIDEDIAPDLPCPGDITVTLPPLACTTDITWPEPQVSVCTAGSVFQLSGPLSGSSFTAGTSTISYGLTSEPGDMLREDFSDNSAGWTLDAEWMIGPATSSFCAASCSGNDPGTDHTPSADNGVAGMNIGGCVSLSIHPFRYLTSPSFDATVVSGSLFLEFWRHLHGDFAPFMQHHVQVFNGTTWVTVWEHLPSTCINDAAWTQQVIDVSAHANAAFAVRFGQAVGQGGAFSSGGWNVDDVRVYDGAPGLADVCNFTVTVLPNTDPGPYSCGAITLPTDPGQCTRARSNVAMTSAFTGCTLDSIQVTGPALLPAGTTTLTYTGWSNGVSQGSCNSSVTIVDEESPAIACGGALLLTADAGSCAATNVVLTPPPASDNCTLASLTSDHPGTTFSTGTTLVTWTAVDAAGNSTQCTQSVTVNGNTGTSVLSACNGDTTLLADPFTCDATFTYTTPALVNNCVNVPLSLLSGLPSGSAFPPGATTVTFGNTGIVFDEDFSDNAAGWTLGPEWQIGPALPSGCANPSVGNDPALDHTATADNGVAGMVIGGCVTTALHPAHHLTSPVVDVTSVSGTLTLSFWRHLHGDYQPFMSHTVQVFDGTTWITIWSHTVQVVLNDPDWTLQSFDVTAYKNAFFQVRFGQSVGAGGAFASGGWSIDDVQLLSAAATTACSFTVTVITPTTYADNDGDGLGDPGAPSTQCPAPIGNVTNNGDACPLLFGTVGDPCDDGDALTQNDVITANCTCTGEGVVRVALKAWLDGAYDANTARMRDDLRAAGLVPTAQPYTITPFSHSGSETVAPAVLANTDPDNAVVDWVLVELRDATTPSLILHRRAALIQRDGDVVDTDGSAPVTFPTPGGPFHVALRHRNHFGAMTAAALPLSGTPTAIDLTSAATPVHGTEARKALPSGTLLLWGCNARPDTLMRYTGSTNDRDPILIAVGGFVPTAVLSNVYRSEDVNMDGTVKYTNTNNDRDPILLNVNWGFAVSSVLRQRFEQLP